jgi:predicted metalloendopeptidase
MGHAIDNQGRQYDRLGQIRDWWTDEDKNLFERRAERLVRQYSAYEPLPNEHIDGLATLSENIADLVGLTIAYDAIELRQGGNLSQENVRQFLSSWAHRWRVKYSDQLLMRVIKSDTHAPNQFRCSGPLDNFAPFYEVLNLSRPDDLVSL